MSAHDDAIAFRRHAPHGGGQMVVVGDSITETNSVRQSGLWGDSWATYATLRSGGKLIHQYAAAKGGYNSTDVRPIFQDEVLGARIPHNLLVIADGTNDKAPMASTLVNDEAMIRDELARGARTVLCTIPPSGMQPLGAPTGLTLTPLPGASGGTLAAGTYYYQIAARGTYGTTTPSTEVSVTLSATGAIQADWAPTGGGVGYVLYGRNTGAKTGYVYINGSGTGAPTVVNRWVDLGTAGISAGPPSSTDTTGGSAVTNVTRQQLATVNGVKRYLAGKYGLTVVDQHPLLTDWSANGFYKKNYTADGTHPIPAIQRLMGVNVADALTPTLPDATYLVDTYDDPSNIGLYPNGGTVYLASTSGLLTPKNTGDAYPADWIRYGDAGYTTTLAVDPAGNVPGFVYTQTRSTWGGFYTDWNHSGGWKVGDRLQFAIKVKSSGLDAIDGGSLNIGVKSTGGKSGWVTGFNITKDVPTTSLPGGWAVWSSEGVISPGTTAIQVVFYLNGAGTSASIAQLTLRNLTALGLANEF